MPALLTHRRAFRPERAWIALLCLLAANSGRVLRAEPAVFSHQVVPLLFKLGCSAGQCHGSFSGKGGFRLSLFASRADLDYANIRYGGFGRRINLHDPAASLLLAKPTAQISHGGGLRLERGSPEYELLASWIAAGAKFDSDQDIAIKSVRLDPTSLTLEVGAAPLSLRALARLADETEVDVTRFAKFESQDPSLFSVDSLGQVSALRHGDAPILAHYAGRIAFATALASAPLPPGLAFVDEPLLDEIDKLVVDKLRRLNLVPSALCDDAEFLRRVYLDTTSTLPTPEQVRAFLADASTDKRAKVIEELLAHPLHAAQWATRLCDMIGADDRFLDSTPFHDWFRNKFAHNAGWDQIAYGVFCATAADDMTPEQVLAMQARAAEEEKRKQEQAASGQPAAPPAEGAPPPLAPWETGYASRRTLDALYSAIKFQVQVRDAEGKETARLVDARQLAMQTANAFLGMQLACAQCHKHPSDKWTQADFLGLASVFSHVELGGPDPRLLAMNVTVNGIHVGDKPGETFIDPVSEQMVRPRALDGPTIDVQPGSDPRQEVWKWLVAPQNPYFARAIVNRVWAGYMGRGLYEPVDAQANANPPSHPELLDHLARDFVDHQFDLRHLERRLLNSLTYQRGWRTNASNLHDQRNYSHGLLRRLTAEQMVDAISQITGTPPKLTKVYGGEIRDGARVIEMSLSRFRGDDWYPLVIFGKPLRVQSCDCERSSAPSLSQALYLYNDDTLWAKIVDESGRLKKLVEQQPDDRALIEELYLLSLSRLPSAAEMDRTLAYLPGVPSRLEAYQDVLWSLLNRQEFLVRH